MTITALPTPPSRADSPGDFSAKADALLGALPAFVTEANALQADVNAKQATATDQAGIAAAQAGVATTQAGVATTQAAAAAASAASALAAPGTNATSATSVAVGTGAKSLTIQPGKSLAIGMSVVIAATASPANRMTGYVTAYDAGTGALTVMASAAAGSGTFADWTVSLGGIPLPAATLAEMQAGTQVDARAMSPANIEQAIFSIGKRLAVSERSANTGLAQADKAKFIRITSGTFAQTLDTSASLGAGWWCYIFNSGSGTITVTPAGAETIDGLTTRSLYPGAALILQCNGVSFSTLPIIKAPRVELLTSGTSWVAPAGCYAVRYRMVGGGGGGGGSAASSTPGASGGYCEGVATTSPGATYAYAVGAGGAAGSGSNSGGSGGSTTMFGATAGGGAGGTYSGATAVINGGSASGGTINVAGQGIGTGASNTSSGGHSMLGAGGAADQQASGGFNHSTPGYGGGGVVATAGGQGCIILEYEV